MDSKRSWLLAGVSAAAVFGTALHRPIPQDNAYHGFADGRTLLGIPKFWNIASNVAFLIAGIAGFRALRKARVRRGPRPLDRAYGFLFGGITLVSAGSAYYHCAPDSDSLVWDRLPMTVAFMSFLAIVIGERIDERDGSRLLPILLVTGASSVLYWHVTESRGHGDLRPYLVVQFLPLVLIALIALLYPRPRQSRLHIWPVLGLYSAAKVFEMLDEPIFRAVRLLSGHTLKHLAAAASAYVVTMAIRRSSRS